MKKALYLILAGVAIGILVAPDKGSETLRKINEGLDDFKKDALDKVNDIVSQGRDLIGKGNTAVQTAKSDLKETANGW